MTPQPAAQIAKHSKSFSLAARALPPAMAHDAAALYAWCRRADDAIDLAPPAQHIAALGSLRRELDAVYAGAPQVDPILAAFQDVVQRRCLPRDYAEGLLDGMEMDVANRRYATLDELLLYCHRVAGTVGLMMCHVLGVSSKAALRHAAHLGMAMQLTNICRDVAEDRDRGRCYLPDELLRPSRDDMPHGNLRRNEMPHWIVSHDEGCSEPRDAVRALLAHAARLYRSGDAGMCYLPWRAAVAIRVARLLYAAIGWRIAWRGYDVWAGRAVVPGAWKLALVTWALLASFVDLPRALVRRLRRKPSAPSIDRPGDALTDTVVRDASDVLPV